MLKVGLPRYAKANIASCTTLEINPQLTAHFCTIQSLKNEPNMLHNYSSLIVEDDSYIFRVNMRGVAEKVAKNVAVGRGVAW